MPKMDDATLRAMLASEYQDALASQAASKLSKARYDAQNYYLGNLAEDMPVQDGRSAAVSMDVSDTIEGMMPQLMEVFAGTDEVVQFAPVGPEDVQQAQQETDYVNHVFMNQNPGFLVLYSFIKDALLSKVGIVKVWWETEDREERETYLDQSEDVYQLLVASDDVEIVEHSEHPDPNQPPTQPGMPPQPPAMLHDVTVSVKKTYAQAKVLGVPPEEFAIERGARSIRDCNYCCHTVIKSEAEWIGLGFDKEQIKKLPTFYAWTTPEEIARDTVDEHATATGDEINKSARQVAVLEHYVRMDYRGDGTPCLYRVTTAQRDGEILKQNGKLALEEFDAIPFAAMTPIIMTHRFYGRSIADLVMDIMRIKTALLRGALDNLYLHNNPRVEVAEAMAGDNTLDDLLVSRPGGIVRTKQPGGLNWQVVPDITASVYPALQYMDATREWRTGVTRQGQGIDANALQNQTATAASQLYTVSMARIRLIARIFAETGIKDMFLLLHGLIRKHGQKAETVRLRNKWVPVDPRNWKTRNDLTVNVGLGTGSKQEQMAHCMLVASLQEKLLLNGKTNLVTDQNVFNLLKDITKLNGKPDTETYFSDPSTQPAPQAPPDPKLVELQMKAQIEQQSLQSKAQVEMQKVQADAAHQKMKTEADIALAERKAQLDAALAAREHEMKLQEIAADAARKHEEHQHKMEQSRMSMAHAAEAHRAKLEQMKSKPEPANG